MKTPVCLNDIFIKGELAVRSGLNFSRLEGDWYRPDEVFKADSHGWPADWEGRIILALTLASKSTHRTAAYLDEIVSLIPEHLNSKGYFGPILDEGKFDEQHVSGHSWIIRGLIEYYEFSKNENVLKILENLLKQFLLPIKGSFGKYPIVPGKRFEEQGVWILSKLQTKTIHHAETSDAGCVFMMIDGATAAYEFFGWPELKEICEELIDRFMMMDLEALQIQTHATLGATRGMLRFYELTGEERYFEDAKKTFELYKETAWTEAYGNYNWFGAPRWTESCAIVDSFMVAVGLWKLTEDPMYLNDAHYIYYNALCHANRVDGSFGTDRCLGAKEAGQNLFLMPVNYDTYWCCTMRGGEGFARAIESNLFYDREENTIYFPFYNDCTAIARLESGQVKLEETTKYPYDGEVSIRILECAGGKSRLKFFVPEFAGHEAIEIVQNGKKIDYEFENGFLVIDTDLRTNDVFRFDLGLGLHVEETKLKNNVSGYHKFMYGPSVLGVKAKKEINTLDGNRFENYAESMYKTTEEINIGKEAVLKRISSHSFTADDGEIVLTMICSVKELTGKDTVWQALFRD